VVVLLLLLYSSRCCFCFSASACATYFDFAGASRGVELFKKDGQLPCLAIPLAGQGRSLDGPPWELFLPLEPPPFSAQRGRRGGGGRVRCRRGVSNGLQRGPRRGGGASAQASRTPDPLQPNIGCHIQLLCVRVSHLALRGRATADSERLGPCPLRASYNIPPVLVASRRGVKISGLLRARS
jgi:hypothetical protein